MSENRIRVSEIFKSVQGEGIRTGYPSVFVRLFGCNLKCKNFNLPLNQQNTEIPAVVQRLKNGEFTDYQQLPIVSTGCDSYPSSWSEFKPLSPEYDNQQLYQRIVDVCGQETGRGLDLVFTGGEPLLKPTQKRLVNWLLEHRHYINTFNSITFETNGTQPLTNDLLLFFEQYVKIPVYFSISPKLACSGEPREKALNPQAIETFMQTCNQLRDHQMYFKFVVTTEQDVLEVINTIKTLTGVDYDQLPFPIFLMPEGGTEQVFNQHAQTVAELAIKYHMVFCYRVHCSVWRNQWSK